MVNENHNLKSTNDNLLHILLNVPTWLSGATVGNDEKFLCKNIGIHVD